jgi:hypothetical protein
VNTPTDDSDRIRTLLDDAVRDVEPRQGLEAIRERAGVRRTHRLRTVGVAVLATAATIAAVTVVANLPDGGGTGPDQVSPAAPAEGPVGNVYFVGDTGAGPRLFAEAHRAPTQAVSLDRAVQIAVEGLADDPDYGTGWPAGTTMQRAQLESGVLSVDLGGDLAQRPAGMTEQQAGLALQQLVYTAQDVAGSKVPVTFLLDGERTDSLLGEPTGRPVGPASAEDTLSSVMVSTPEDGARVRSPFTVTGEASAFEGNVQWELKAGDAVVDSGFATARESGTLAPYSFTVKAPAGTYTLVVHDEDVSDGEGVPPTQDTKQVVVE